MAQKKKPSVTKPKQSVKRVPPTTDDVNRAHRSNRVVRRDDPCVDGRGEAMRSQQQRRLRLDHAVRAFDDHVETQRRQPLNRIGRSRDTRLVRVKLTRDEYRLPHRMILSAGT